MSFCSFSYITCGAQGIDQRSMTLIHSRLGARCCPCIPTTRKSSSERDRFADVLSRRCRLVRQTRQRCSARIFRLPSVCHENPVVQWRDDMEGDIAAPAGCGYNQRAPHHINTSEVFIWLPVMTTGRKANARPKPRKASRCRRSSWINLYVRTAECRQQCLF